MNVWAIVPVKPLNRAKSRLASLIPAEIREKLAADMLRNTIATLTSSRAISGVLVISRDNRALVIARKHGARTVQESGAPALNAALERANQIIASWNAQAALVLPADLPLLTADDLLELTDLGRYNQSVVIVPDRNENGTNALLMRPADMFPCRFGEHSFEEHLAQADALNATIHVFRSERMMLDLDAPEDLYAYLQYCEVNGIEPLVDLSLNDLEAYLATQKEEI